ncbi:MAG: hypothetical protein ACE14P_07875 [Methanotrichaceae archaeon]
MALLSTLPHITESQSSASATDNAIVRKLIQELQNLKAERQQLLAKIKSLESLQELNNGYVLSKEDIMEAFNEQTNMPLGLPAKISELGQEVNLLKRKINAIEKKKLKSYGKTTVHRIEKLKELLKGYGGSQAFKQLQSDMGLSPSQFTRLVNCLDERIFEVKRCPGAQRGEKMLILK